MTKNIAIMDKAYALLAAHKLPGESFSNVILREIGHKKRRLSELLPSLPVLTDSEAESIKKHIREGRERWTAKSRAKWDPR